MNVELISIVGNFILASGIISMALFYRSKKRKARSEAEKSETDAKKDRFQLEKDQLQWYKDQLNEAYQKLDSMQDIIDKLREDILNLKKEINKYRLNIVNLQQELQILDYQKCINLECKDRVPKLKIPSEKYTTDCKCKNNCDGESK